jgi:hypothetical protein
MTTPPDTERLRRAGRRALARLPDPAVLARVGLGAAIGLAGLHKLVAPGAWTAYVVDWLAPLLVVSPRTFMLLNGPPELLAGALLVADRYTALAAAVVAVSLAGTLVYLTLAALTAGGFVTVIVRDLGLLALALSVLAGAR